VRDILDLIQLDDLFDPLSAWYEMTLGANLGNLRFERIEVDRSIVETREDILKQPVRQP
jgi:hypothetical protein